MGNISIKKVIERYTQKIINKDKGIILYELPKNLNDGRKETYSHYKVKLMPSGKQKYLDIINSLKDYNTQKEKLLSIKTTITITRSK